MIDDIAITDTGENKDTSIVNVMFMAQKPLILLDIAPSADMVASALGLVQYYLAQDVVPILVCPINCAQILSFLPRGVEVKDKIGQVQDFVLQFHTTRHDIADVVIERDVDMVRVVVTPAGSYIDPKDFSFAPSRAHYDSIIMIGSDATKWMQVYPDIASTGALADVRQYIFTPTSAFPIIAQAFAQQFASAGIMIPALTAQCLLAGIVSVTDGLRSSWATADIFHTAARLMRYGADLQEIMMRLYKDVSLEFLQLWGLMLSHLILSPNKICAITILPTPQPSTATLTIVAGLHRTAQSLPQVQILIALWSIADDDAIKQTYQGIAYRVTPQAPQLPSSCHDITTLSQAQVQSFVTSQSAGELLHQLTK